MKLPSFLSSSDTPDLVHKAIKHQTDWLDSLSNASYFDAGEAGDRKTWADCEKLGCFGANEAAQKPLPETHIQEFRRQPQEVKDAFDQLCDKNFRTRRMAVDAADKVLAGDWQPTEALKELFLS